MANKSRYTLPRELEIARIEPSAEAEEGERIELRRFDDAFTAVMITRRGGRQHAGEGEFLEGALDSLARAMPAAAIRTTRAGATVASSKMRHLEGLLTARAGCLTLQRSTSLKGAWTAELAGSNPEFSRRVFADTIAEALAAVADSSKDV